MVHAEPWCFMGIFCIIFDISEGLLEKSIWKSILICQQKLEHSTNLYKNLNNCFNNLCLSWQRIENAKDTEAGWWLELSIKRFFGPLKNFSLIWGRHHYRWRAANFWLMLGIYSKSAVNLKFFNVPHLLWHGTSAIGSPRLLPSHAKSKRMKNARFEHFGG